MLARKNYRGASSFKWRATAIHAPIYPNSTAPIKSDRPSDAGTPPRAKSLPYSPESPTTASLSQFRPKARMAQASTPAPRPYKAPMYRKGLRT